MVQTSRQQGIIGNEGMKTPCRVASTVNITTLSGLLNIDSVVLVDNDRVLVKDQTTGLENGIYVAHPGVWIRAGDWDGARDIRAGTLVPVAEGSANQLMIFQVQTSDPITIGSTSIIIGPTPVLTTSVFMATFLDDLTASDGRATLFGASTLQPLDGGTGIASPAANSLLLAAGASPFTTLAPGASGNVVKSNGTIWTSAAGGSGSGIVQQIVHAKDSTINFQSSAAAFNYDNSIPGNTEGDEFMTLAITPLDSSNFLYIDMVGNFELSDDNFTASMGLFQDSITNALAAVAEFSVSFRAVNLVIKHRVAAVNTTLRTYKMRAGPSTIADFRFNPVTFGGLMSSTMTITEMTE